jgi:hypothetical protein
VAGESQPCHSTTNRTLPAGVTAAQQPSSPFILQGQVALTCAALHDAHRAAQLYELLLPYARYNNRMTRIGIGSLGPIAHYLGLLAATMTRWDAAADHFEAAMQMSTHMAAPVFLANSRYHYAQTLLATPGRGEAARGLMDQALATARALGIRLQLEGRSPGTPESRPAVEDLPGRSPRRHARAACEGGLQEQGDGAGGHPDGGRGGWRC